jgi:hypothetical protein
MNESRTLLVHLSGLPSGIDEQHLASMIDNVAGIEVSVQNVSFHSKTNTATIKMKNATEQQDLISMSPIRMKGILV